MSRPQAPTKATKVNVSRIVWKENPSFSYKITKTARYTPRKVEEVLASSEVSKKMSSSSAASVGNAILEEFQKLLASESTERREIVEDSGMDLPK